MKAFKIRLYPYKGFFRAEAVTKDGQSSKFFADATEPTDAVKALCDTFKASLGFTPLLLMEQE